MLRRLAVALPLALAVVALTAGTAPAWEAATTHAGLTEQSALASGLHQHLRDQFGIEAGLLAELTVPPDDAAPLFALLRRLDPSHGYVPDARGRLDALGWLVAGSVVADTPARHAAHHFFDPRTGGGLAAKTLRGLGERLRHRLVPALAGERVVRSGVPAADWITDADNPMGWQGFAGQYRKAIGAATAAERRRHLAGALLAAGAMLHVLQDMGSPSHVRNDLAAHLERLGPQPDDVGSRFERLAALAYDRLGIPRPTEAPTPRPLRAYFTAGDGSGLADHTARSYFSTHTLPAPTELHVGAPAPEVERALARVLRRPEPAPARPLDLIAARDEDGAVLRDDAGTCLARYQLRRGVLRWSMDDACAIEQLAALLPRVGGYGAGFLDHLFRGTLTLEQQGNAVRAGAGDLALGAGRVTAYWDDARGVRSEYAGAEVAPGAALVAPAPPAGAASITIFFDGVDQSGAPLLAAGTLALR